MSPISARCQNTCASDDDDDVEADEAGGEEGEGEGEGEGGGWPSRKLPLRRAAKTGERATRMTLEAKMRVAGVPSWPTRSSTSAQAGLSTMRASWSPREVPILAFFFGVVVVEQLVV